MKNTELETYIKLKYFPYKATQEYIDSLPAGVPRRLYNELFEYGNPFNEARGISMMMLMNRLSMPTWEYDVNRLLMEILVEYYEHKEKSGGIEAWDIFYIGRSRSRPV